MTNALQEKAMIHPGREYYLQTGAHGTRIPVYREIAGDMLTPISLLECFSDVKNLFLLESANLDKSFSRYTFFGIRPGRMLLFQDGTLVEETAGGQTRTIETNPVDYITQELSREKGVSDGRFGNFGGGYVGYIGYDMANYTGMLRSPIREESSYPTMALFQVDEFYVFDNAMGRLYAAACPPCGDDPAASYEAALARTAEMAVEILGSHKKTAMSDSEFAPEQDFDRESFVAAVQSLKNDITAGECIQAVLSNRYTIRGRINPIQLYRMLRNINPSPYMFYLKHGDLVLCGTSPEIHLKITEGTAILKPIAGTYPNREGQVEEIKAALLKDEKERAEHLMLLDLARNDLYTGCDHESVRVTSSFSAEVYSHVIHIVSEVQGRVKPDVHPFRLFCNTFPAGTVSGAPKVRAMELINQYERSPRGFYAGCAGYFSYTGDIDTCIIIRSACVTARTVTLRAGAGIVYDSVPEREYVEVGNKLGALFQALNNIPVLEKQNVFNDR